MRDWLGLSSASTVIGLDLRSPQISAVAVRPDPLRVVAVGRRLVGDASIVGRDVRLAAAVGADLASLVGQCRLPADTAAVVAVEVADRHVAVLAGRASAPCSLRRSALDRVDEAVERSGLRRRPVDAVPVALARLTRLARRSTEDVVVVRSPDGWTLMAGPDFLEAERATTRDGGRLRIGPDLASLRPFTVDELPIEVPARVRSALDLDRDAIALGAALAPYELAPSVDVVPLIEQTDGDRWVAHPVDAAARSHPDRGCGGRRPPPPEPRSTSKAPRP